jgi:hypothetical protein
MDSGEPNPDFEGADRRYAQLKRLHEAGNISEVEFDEQLSRSMVQDQWGRWWVKSRKSGEWHYHDGSTWVRSTPPGYAPTDAGNGGTRHRRGIGPVVILALLVVVVVVVGAAVGAVMYLNIIRPQLAEQADKREGGERVDQSKGNEEPDAGVKAAPGHKVIQAPAGGLTVEVPAGWEADTGEDSEFPSEAPGAVNWSSFAGEEITSSITTASSVNAWYNSDQPSTGAYLVASKALARDYSNDELIYSGIFSDLANVCDQGPYEDFDNSSLKGKTQIWYNCRGLGIINIMVAAAPEGRECVVVLQARIANEAGRDPVQHMLDTVDADCGKIAETEHRGVAFASLGADIPAG